MVLHRYGATSHRRYRAEISGKVYFVDVAGHSDKDEIAPGTHLDDPAIGSSKTTVSSMTSR
jgi:hypothetical protein